MKNLLMSIAMLSGLGLVAGAAAASTVTLNWTPPTTRTDGSALAATAIAGADICVQIIPASAPPATCSILPANGGGSVVGAVGTFKTPTLAPGTYNFTVTTRDTSTPTLTSGPSNVFTTTITVPAPAAITNLTGTVGP